MIPIFSIAFFMMWCVEKSVVQLLLHFWCGLFVLNFSSFHGNVQMFQKFQRIRQIKKYELKIEYGITKWSHFLPELIIRTFCKLTTCVASYQSRFLLYFRFHRKISEIIDFYSKLYSKSFKIRRILMNFF